jgi:transcriptional regulator with XRE-family HTH domain
MTLGQRIKERRQALGITQQSLATSTRITIQHISAIEQNKRVPSIGLLIRLSERLTVSLDYLIIGKEVVTDIILAIQADSMLDTEMKKSLINLVVTMRGTLNKQGKPDSPE